MHLLLIDGNSIGFAANSMNKLNSGDVETQAIFGSLRTVRTLLENHPGARPIVFWDGNSWRKQADPEYKANRDDDPKAAAARESYKKQRPKIATALALLGVRQMSAGNMEADDMIAKTARSVERAPNTAMKATVVSGDRDLLQLVSQKVDWLNPILNQGGNKARTGLVRVTYGDFAEQTDYESVVAFVQGKALLGDASDNLKGVQGIGKKCAPLLLQHYGSVRNAIERIRAEGENAIPDHMRRYRKALLGLANDPEQIRRFVHNMKMMDLFGAAVPPVEDRRDVNIPINKDGFKDFCMELGFMSIMKQFDAWCLPFERVASGERAA